MLPGNALPKTRMDLIPNFDKLVHFFLFALLAGLVLKAQKKVTIYNCLSIAALTLGYGIAMEYVQKYWVPHRSFDMMDIWADGLGAMAGVALVAWWGRQRNAKPKV
jgi:VanZ family protein